MFNLCRRGPASISRVIGSVARIPSTRSSALSPSFQNVVKPALEARWLQVSPLRLQHASAQQYEQPTGSSKDIYVEKFQELIDHNLVHPNVVSAITKGMGHETMTQVQSMTINQALQGDDMQVKPTAMLDSCLTYMQHCTGTNRYRKDYWFPPPPYSEHSQEEPRTGPQTKILQGSSFGYPRNHHITHPRTGRADCGGGSKDMREHGLDCAVCYWWKS